MLSATQLIYMFVQAQKVLYDCVCVFVCVCAGNIRKSGRPRTTEQAPSDAITNRKKTYIAVDIDLQAYIICCNKSLIIANSCVQQK